MFKFNFSNPQEDSISSEYEVTANNHQGVTGELEWFPAAEIFPPTNPSYLDETVNVFTCGTYNIKHVDVAKTLCNLIPEAEQRHSDLLPAKYEGGLKIWECTSDLATYILEHGVQFRGKRVLDLGCGAGILGILAIHLGAIAVHFQDYNSSVLTAATIPNVMMNAAGLQEVPNTRFFSGDWGSFVQLLDKESPAKEEKYDCILTSETIYNADNHTKLLDVFKHCLDVDGNVYLAAKTCYFGVGGSIRQFETLIAEDGIFNFTVCWKCSKGVQREILQITFNEELKQ